MFHRGREYVSGETLEAEGANAQYLIDGGFCEIVRRLRPLKQTRPQIGGGGWIVNFSENEYRAIDSFSPRF